MKKFILNSKILKIAFASLLITSTGMSVSACASKSGSKSLAKKSEQEILAQIAKGKTTKAEIEKNFGKPQSTSFQADGTELWSYTYSESSKDGTSYIPLVGSFAGSSSTESKTLNVFFSKQGIVKDYSLSSSKNKEMHNQLK